MLKDWLESIPPITRHLLLLNVLFFVAGLAFENQGILLNKFLAAYFPLSVHFRPYQLLTYMFMHANWMHLAFNLFALVSFGSRIEYVLGEKKYLFYYLFCGFGSLLIYFFCQWAQILYLLHSYQVPEALHSGLLHFAAQDLRNPENLRYLSDFLQIQSQSQVVEWPYLLRKLTAILHTPLLGASGAIYGLLFAFAYFFPNEQLLLLFPPIPIAAKYLLTGLFLFSLYMGISDNAADNTAHFAHLGGIIVGALWMWWSEKRGWRR